MKQSRRGKYGAMVTTITVLGIVLIIVANIVVGQLTEKYGWSIDLTADDRYAISDESIQYLKRLKDEVDITVFVDENPCLPEAIIWYRHIRTYCSIKNTQKK